MRYRRPFTPEQRRDAIRRHDSFVRHLRLLRRSFRPHSARQNEILRRYREHVRAIATELRRPDSRVRIDELSDQIELAALAIVEYFRAHHFDR